MGTIRPAGLAALIIAGWLVSGCVAQSPSDALDERIAAEAAKIDPAKAADIRAEGCRAQQEMYRVALQSRRDGANEQDLIGAAPAKDGALWVDAIRRAYTDSLDESEQWQGESALWKDCNSHQDM